MRRLRAGASTVAIVAAVSLLAACSGGNAGESTPTPTKAGESSAPAGEPVTIEWWHNSNTGEGKEYYDKVAADFAAANPGLTIKVEAMQHEDMLTKLDAAFQANNAPDIYMERGGGELAAHVAAGLTKDLTESAAEEITKIGGSIAGWQHEGKTYGLPFSIGVVGFWYNKAMFADAGITAAPTTWDEMYQAIDKLKAAKIEPISVGAGSKWPAAHYWYYFGMRHCSQQVLADAVTALEFSDPCFIRAGEDLQKLIAAKPFNSGFLATEAQGTPESASGLLANRKVAMELAGHWEPGVMQGLTEDEKGLGEDTGWFAFPAVTGGQGDQAAQLGGGDAWGVAADAPDVAVSFVKHLLSDEIQKGFAELDMGLPTNPTATQYVADPALAGLLDVRDAAPYVQLYFDTAFGPSIGGAMNDEIALMFAEKASPQDIVKATQAAADAEK